jgi:hypothetical protein
MGNHLGVQMREGMNRGQNVQDCVRAVYIMVVGASARVGSR